MRITVHLSTFDQLNPRAYAIIWLDRDRQQWSRESHSGLALPAWGTLRAEPGGTLICDERGSAPLLVLEGFALDGAIGPFEGETGGAIWNASRRTSRGHWHVQCVDEVRSEPEHSLFAGDGAYRDASHISR
jgi:Protein of unknown function (DUF3564)